MTIQLKILLALVVILPLSICHAQPKVVRITDSFFDNPSHQLVLSEMDGWYFRQGNDTASAAKEISMNGWKKMQPSELNESYAVNGKVEAWFRISVSLDSSLKNIPSGITSPIWAASDVYINGNRAASFGQTGSSDKAYQENRPFWKEPVPVEVSPGKTYSIVVHVVDQIVPLSGGSLRSFNSFSKLLILTTALTPAFSKHADRGVLTLSVLLAVTGVISILSWFFWLMNTKEKNQLGFALCCTFISLAVLCADLEYANPNLSFNGAWLIDFLWSSCIAIVQVLVFIIITTVLNYKAHRLLRIIVYTMIAIVFFTFRLPKLLPIAAFANIPYVFVCVLIVVTRWKKLKGAQWAIALGLLSAIIFLTLSFAQAMIPHVPQWVTLSISVVGIVSFPLGLMIYAALRFKEINRETEIQAGKVIQLSEEKKEQALNQQKILEEEVRRQTADLRKTLDDLKATQAQLIQSEKMASLGELTAGIAHEIQNPLNFVNNFSEVNRELIEEVKSQKLKLKSEELDELLNDIADNEEKINHHGKRADAIVKGMLQHSRTSSGQKELTDINALANEYLRLAYHGLRAKDKSFNADIKAEFDDSVGKINIVPQDIGRVLLNLYNNAFYAVNEQKKTADEDYQSTITVQTKKLNDKIEIRVEDNGNGIPQKALGKIFQPFFTTKPTGQGTGLGLRLAYDIVTKGHGGELKVETKEGQGSEFIIQLPGM